MFLGDAMNLLRRVERGCIRRLRHPHFYLHRSAEKVKRRGGICGRTTRPPDGMQRCSLDFDYEARWGRRTLSARATGPFSKAHLL